MKFQGSFPALITPMKDGAVDEAAYRKFVAWQIKEGSHGLVPVGTTGESPTVTPAEHKRLIEICVEEAKGKVPVIAGAGSNNTAEAIEYAAHAKKAGADAALIVCALLQQAHPGRHLPALRAIAEGRGYSDFCLQRAGPHRVPIVGRNA